MKSDGAHEDKEFQYDSEMNHWTDERLFMKYTWLALFIFLGIAPCYADSTFHFSDRMGNEGRLSLPSQIKNCVSSTDLGNLDFKNEKIIARLCQMPFSKSIVGAYGDGQSLTILLGNKFQDEMEFLRQYPETSPFQFENSKLATACPVESVGYLLYRTANSGNVTSFCLFEGH